MLEKIVVELTKRVRRLQTLSSQKENIIKKWDNSGIYVETEASRKKYQAGERAEPFDFNSYDFLLKGWEEFVEHRKANADDFKKTRGRTSFLMALFSQLPFVEVAKIRGKTCIQLREFLTDELPSEQYHKVKNFLEEVIEKKYNPQELSKHFDGNLYRIKSRGRQDARMLGFVNENNEANEVLLNGYADAADKDKYIKDILVETNYFQVALICLDLLRELPKKEKRLALEELGMLIVKSSTGTNLMVESVAKERNHNLLMWLEETKLIDNNWSPYENFFDLSHKKEKAMDSHIRDSLLKIMKDYLQARRESFGGHLLGSFVRKVVPREFIELPFIDSNSYTVTGSVGQGNWAAIPWIAIMNKEVTTSTQRGYYIVYLFTEDMQSVYLTLAQGVTETSMEEMLRIKKAIRESILDSSKVHKDDDIYLGDSRKARDYATSTAAYIKYDLEHMPEEEIFVSDLEEMIRIYERFIEIQKGNFSMEYESESLANVGQETPPQNISSQNLITHIHNYITSKGFFYTKDDVTNLFLSLKAKPFVILSGISGTGKTMLIKWFAESIGANKDNGRFTLIPIRPDWNDGSDLLGYKDIKGDFQKGPLTKVIEKAHENPELPYFVLLDEMNLARVEYYFSDILSVMETREWKDGTIVSSKLLTKETADFDLTLPSNLYVIGTVNMDETTHPFSKKVLDRANTIEFNQVNLGNLAFLGELEEQKPLLLQSDPFKTQFLHLKDAYRLHEDIVKRATDELMKVNEVLMDLQAHVGYRVRDEICFYLAHNKTGGLLSFETAFDYCLMQKILPRISGSDARVERMLQRLYTLFSGKRYDESETNFDSAKYPRSAAKVSEMLRRLDDGFTSFWIS